MDRISYRKIIDAEIKVYDLIVTIGYKLSAPEFKVLLIIDDYFTKILLAEGEKLTVNSYPIWRRPIGISGISHIHI